MRYAESGFGPAHLSANLNRSLRFGDYKTGATAALGLSLNASEASTSASYSTPARMTPSANASLSAWKALSSWGRVDCSGAITPSLFGAETQASANCGVSARKSFGSRVYSNFGFNAGRSGVSLGATNLTGNANFQLTPAPKRAPRFRMNTGARYALNAEANGSESAQWSGQFSGSYAWQNGVSLNLGANVGLRESSYAATQWSTESTNTGRSVGATASLGGTAGEGRWYANLSASQNASQSSWGASVSRQLSLTTTWSGAAEPGRWQTSLSSSLNLSRSGQSASNSQRLSLYFRPVPREAPLSEAQSAPAPKPMLSVAFDLSRSVSRSAWGASENWNAGFRIERSFGFWRQQTSP